MPGWDAWTAIGTLTLAAATIGLAWVTVRTANADRHHDDAKRAEDRARFGQGKREPSGTTPSIEMRSGGQRHHLTPSR